MTGHHLLRSAVVAALLCSVYPSTTAAQSIEYYHLDAIGSVRAVTDQGGAIIERHDYQPFGEEFDAPTVSQSRQFTGQERDAETGLDYFGARYYSGKRGRFTTVDPVTTLETNLVEPQRWNRYAYVLNNPLRYTDPDGRNPLLAAVAVVWTVYEVGSAIYDGYFAFRTVSDPSSSGADKAIAISAAGASIIGPGGGYGAAADAAAAMRRGREAEKRILDALGEVKNTAKVEACGGCSIPDFINARQVGEIKDAKRVSNTEQSRIQRQAAQDAGKQHVLVTGSKTRVSGNAAKGTEVVRKRDLGPK